MVEASEILTTFLREVSRSFYLTLRVLPGAIRSQIGLAYLLARTTDTIADTELVPVKDRLTALQALRNRIQGKCNAALEFGEMVPKQASPAEERLLLHCDEIVALLASLSEQDRELVRSVLETITSGQELDLQRFGDASPDSPSALQTDEELDDYTYRVAGCVGEFWTRMCRAHVFPAAKLDLPGLLELGVRFGKGLQLVNILRDLPADLRRGRCYLPLQRLAECDLKPRDLLEPGNESRLRPCYNLYLDRAAAHLQAGWRYTNTLPARCVRIRLACAWPVLIGLETIELLRSGSILGASTRLKVSRRRIRRILAESVLLLPCPALWRRMGEGKS